MKKAKIVIIDNEDGEGWFIGRIDYVTEDDEFIDGESVGIKQGEAIKIGENLEDNKFLTLPENVVNEKGEKIPIRAKLEKALRKQVVKETENTKGTTITCFLFFTRKQ